MAVGSEADGAGTAGSEADGSEVDGAVAAKGSAGADGGVGSGATKAPKAEDGGAEGVGRVAADGVEIPKQQSTDEVVEHEAGEGART
ncbi:hypothetical protein [Streptomyces carpinensis]|uniref:Uncharacterized protein n=1 Tax=Streptomyces carpinensis TaxID=66369 RepID=A0ABV1WBT9_9ACTN